MVLSKSYQGSYCLINIWGFFITRTFWAKSTEPENQSLPLPKISLWLFGKLKLFSGNIPAITPRKCQYLTKVGTISSLLADLISICKVSNNCLLKAKLQWNTVGVFKLQIILYHCFCARVDVSGRSSLLYNSTCSHFPEDPI